MNYTRNISRFIFVQMQRILVLLVLFTTPVSAQQLGIFAGYCNNHYFDLQEENSHQSTEYSPGNGATVGFSIGKINLIDPIRSDTNQLKFVLSFTGYSGQLSSTDGGLGGSSSMTLKTEKYIVALGFYPLNIRLYRELYLGFGCEFNYLLAHHDEGEKSSWNMNGVDTTINLKDSDLHHPLNFGINFSLDYNVGIGKQYYLVPSYVFYIGMGKEFKDVNGGSCYRHFLNLGIAKRF
jgi:hypothetical protein